MKHQLRAWFRGAVASAACVAIYAIALGFFLALTLLVASMEEGGGNLSESAPSLTQTIILLSEGIGFRTDSLTVTITPLLLTGLLIALLAACARHLRANAWQGYLSGAIVWQLIMLVIANGPTLALTDPLWMVSIKSFTVYSCGMLLAMIPHSTWLESLRLRWREHVSLRLRETLRSGILLGLALLAIYLCIAIITTLIWIVMNHQGMGRVFQLSGMRVGSRILTTICSLAWLPNFCLWAMSWVFGGGFAIGDLATFTLWTGESTSLPPLPVFGLLPTAVASPQLRTVLVMLPIVIASVLGLIMLVGKRWFSIRLITPQDGHIRIVETLVGLACAAGAFCLASVVLTLGTAALFRLSTGSLGRQRLRHVGVDVMSSTRTLGHPTAMGLLVAWLVMAVVIAAVYGFHAAHAHFVQRGSGIGHGTDGDESHTDAVRDGRVSSSRPVDTGTSPNTRVIISMTQRKEDHDDDNTATDTQGPGIGLS